MQLSSLSQKGNLFYISKKNNASFKKGVLFFATWKDGLYIETGLWSINKRVWDLHIQNRSYITTNQWIK